MAKRAEEFEKRSNAINFRRAISYEPSQIDKGKTVAQTYVSCGSSSTYYAKSG